VHQLIISPFLGTYLVLRPGRPNAVKISQEKYAQLQSAGPDGLCPDWLDDAAMRSWGTDISGRPLSEFASFRTPSPLPYGRASYELNMGCNYDCRHCYLGLKQFAGLEWKERGKSLTRCERRACCGFS
jgi:hypothetical protein